MSRTYRHRHLPRLKARKYVDGNPGRYYHELQERADSVMRELYPFAFKENGRIKLAYWSLRRMIVDQLDRDFVVPVGNKACHPWAPWWRFVPTKAWYKKSGNRRVRRHNRDVVHRFAHLGDDVDQKHRFFDKKDGWNKRSLY